MASIGEDATVDQFKVPTNPEPKDTSGIAKSFLDEGPSFNLETPIIVKKPPRRSSIFRAATSERSTLSNNDMYPPNYGNLLMQENAKWSEAYQAAKAEYLELKEKEKTVEPIKYDAFEIYRDYVKRAEDFCCQVNNMAELHENAINYLKIRRQELEQEVEARSKRIRQKLNVKVTEQ